MLIVMPHKAFGIALVAALLSLSLAGSYAQDVLSVEALGKGTVPLNGPWQFHLGDNPQWALPAIDDVTGHDGWEQLKVDSPWGAQTHPNTIGFGWYRRHIDLSLAPGAAPDLALLIPAIDDAYEISDEEALPILFDLLEHEGLCMGGSTGINVAGAIRMARDLGPGHTIVTVLADYGNRYQSKLFNPAFLREKNLPCPPWLVEKKSPLTVPYENPVAAK